MALLCVMQVGGCTFITNFREYRIDGPEDDQADGVCVHLSFTPTRYTYMRLPGLYDLERYRDPYQCHFTVWGDFDEITSIDASMVINNDPPTAIPLNVNKLNHNRKLSHANQAYFPAGEIQFDAKAEEIKTISVTTKFSVVVGGRAKTYTITNNYKVTVHEETGNRWWLAVMGI
jgi:hypothetical protein